MKRTIIATFILGLINMTWGQKFPLKIVSNTQAIIKQKGEEIGKTPHTIDAKKAYQYFSLSAPGYETREICVVKKMNGTYPELNISLPKIPSTIEGINLSEGTYSIEVLRKDTVFLFTDKNKKLIDNIRSSKTHKTENAEDYAGKIENELELLGYSDLANQNQQVKLSVKVTNPLMHLKQYKWGYELVTSLKYHWKLQQANTGKEIYSKTTNVSNNQYSKYKMLTLDNFVEYYVSIFDDTFIPNLYEFLNSEETINQIESLAKNGIQSDSITIITRKNNEGNINESTKSVVTLKNGNSHGSGFLISADGHILTNQHVVGDNKNITVRFESGLELNAEVIRTNTLKDLAIVKIPGTGFNPITIEKKYNLSDEVYAIGTSADEKLSQSITKGIVSSKRIDHDIKYIQTDVSINPGNSGGPLLNKDGNAIGIVTKKLVGEGVEGIGFAIQIDEAIEGLEIKLQ